MITLDYVIANDDRHLNNFGLLRDAETLEWLGPAPLYDCGSSLGNGLLTSEFPTMAGKRCKPFKGAFEEQIRLVRDFDVSRLDGVLDALLDVERILDMAGDRLEGDRTAAITSLITDRVGSARKVLSRAP